MWKSCFCGEICRSIRFCRHSCLAVKNKLSVFIGRKVCLSKMSTTAGPVCPKFIPVEQSEIASISKSDGLYIGLES